MDEPFTQMRDFIMVTENLDLADADDAVPELIVESSDVQTPLLADLAEVVFKLRAFMESSDGDYALGVEMGMQRAAEMIENVIRRHRQGVSSLG